MKKSVSIWDMLKNQNQNNISCPACNHVLPKTKLNFHLDFECKSSITPVEVRSVADDKSIIKEENSDSSNKFKSESNIKENSVDICKTVKVESNVIAQPKSIHTVKCSNAKPTISPVKNGRVIQAPKSTRNTSAPWRMRGNKRKRSPIKKDEKKTAIHVNNSELSQASNVEAMDISVENKDSHHSTLLEADEKDLGVIDFSEDMSEEINKPEIHEPYSPYYIANFKHIVDRVLEDDFNKHLFDETDLNCIRTFNSLSDAAQKLYVRLFQRKYKWLRISQINYPLIAQDLTVVLEELVKQGFVNSGRESMELNFALNLLSLPEAKTLSKQFNFNSSGKSKTEIKELLIKHGKQHKSLFSSSSSANCVSNAILKKVLQIMGPCYILELVPKKLFSRILMLFSLSNLAEDDEEAAGGQQQQLITLLQVNKGEIKFPTYQMHRVCLIFETRDDLIRYEAARQLENDIMNAVDSKKFDLGKELYQKAKEEFSKLKEEGFANRDEQLPLHLRRFTAGHVYTRCLNQGVEILQRLRQYDEAVQLLRRLLQQMMYCQDRKGKWWDRLALNLEQHLKKPDEVTAVIKDALDDKNVRVGPRLALLTRAQRLLKGKCKDEELRSYLLEMDSIVECPKITIRGRLLPRPIPGRRHIFISSDPLDDPLGDDFAVLSVEQLAIEHYKTTGYTEGVHGEGSTFISLYALLFWDIIYDGSIADVFISPYQPHPLDLNSGDFYKRREDQIVSHLDTIRNCSDEGLIEICQSSWASHNGTTSLVNWDIFTSVERLLGLVQCLGKTLLAGICERLANDFRFTRSGVPDLVVWNPETKQVKIVEVKGPGDKLSMKQILWLDYLLKLGADAEVCLVEAVGSKKLRKTE